MEDKMFNDIIDSIINNASDDEIEIIREKLNNHLINHIYDSNIHEELSNNYDSSFCPHCQNKHIIKHFIFHSFPPLDYMIEQIKMVSFLL